MTAAPPSANARFLYIVSSHHGRSGNPETWQHAGQVSGAGVRVYTETMTFSSEDLLSGLIMISSLLAANKALREFRLIPDAASVMNPVAIPILSLAYRSHERPILKI